ncbi:MAG: flagellar type III secretion system protein FlhB [Pseudomonadota bacterium]
MSSDGAAGGGEKTFDPTPKRLEDARRRGDIAKSEEITGAAVYIGFFVVAVGGGAMLMGEAAAVLSAFLSRSDLLTGVILGPGGGEVMGQMLAASMAPLLPFFAVPALGAIIGLLGQRAIVFATERIRPKPSKLSPLGQIKQKFGPTGLVDFLKRVVKLCAVSITAYLILRAELDVVIGSVRGSPGAVTELLFELILALLIGVTLMACAIAAVDYSWVQFDHIRKQKMSLQEVRDESKESDGDPTLKAKRRRRGEEIATNKMLAEVPKADVVLVNPIHIAIALKWARTPGSAPACVAKGKGEVANRIREVAEEAGVPIHQDVPTARALYDLIELDQEVPPEHYRAVAVAIRFAEDMRSRMRARGTPTA